MPSAPSPTVTSLPTLATGYDPIPPREDWSAWNVYSPTDGDELQDILDGTTPITRPARVVLDSTVNYSRADYVVRGPLGGDPSLGWIYVTTDDTGLALLPAEGNRIYPRDDANHASGVATLTSTLAERSVIRFVPGAGSNRIEKMRFIGIEFTKGNVSVTRALVDGCRADDDTQGATVAEFPKDIIIEQFFLHGHPDVITHPQREGIAPHWDGFAVIDGWIDDIRGFSNALGAEALGIWIHQPCRDGTIENNYVDATGIPIMHGGSPIAASHSPRIWENIVIRGNETHHNPKYDPDDPSYVGSGDWIQKTHIEAKGADRLLIENNYCHEMWKADGGQGNGLKISNTNQTGVNPEMRSRDLEVRYNYFDGMVSGFQLVASSEANVTEHAARWNIHNNFVQRTNRKNVLATQGDLIHGGALPSTGSVMGYDIRIAKNTFVGRADGSLPSDSGAKHGQLLLSAINDSYDRIDIYDNILQGGTFGVFRNGGAAGELAHDAEFINYYVAGNVAIGNLPASQYPPSYNQDEIGDIGFTDRNNGDWSLLATSDYAAGNAEDATDGTDVGSRWATLLTKIAPAQNGTRIAGMPSTSPSSSPSSSPSASPSSSPSSTPSTSLSASPSASASSPPLAAAYVAHNKVITEMKKNTALTLTAVMIDLSDGTAIASGVTVTVSGSGSQAASTNTPTHLGGGEWQIVLTAAEMNHDVVGVTFYHPDAADAHHSLHTVSNTNDDIVANTATVNELMDHDTSAHTTANSMGERLSQLAPYVNPGVMNGTTYDEYTVTWDVNGLIATTVTSPAVTVIRTSDNSSLFSGEAMTEVGTSTGVYRYTETTNRMSGNDSYAILFTAVVNGQSAAKRVNFPVNPAS